MARQTRQQRRAASRAGESAEEQGIDERASAREAQVRPAVEPTKAQAGAPRRRLLGGVGTYTVESWAELKKVEWPRQRQLITGTTVVIVACLVVGVYLYACDQAFKHLVQNVFLGQ